MPTTKSRTALYRELKAIFQRSRSQPIRRVIEEVNPKLAGWANYFRMGHSSRCFSRVRDWVEKKMRRQVRKARLQRGFGWDRWSREVLYGQLGLYADYRIRRLPSQAVLPYR